MERLFTVTCCYLIITSFWHVFDLICTGAIKSLVSGTCFGLILAMWSKLFIIAYRNLLYMYKIVKLNETWGLPLLFGAIQEGLRGCIWSGRVRFRTILAVLFSRVHWLHNGKWLSLILNPSVDLNQTYCSVLIMSTLTSHNLIMLLGLRSPSSQRGSKSKSKHQYWLNLMQPYALHIIDDYCIKSRVARY